MLNLDPAKLFVILVVAFLVLGPERLPRVARQLGGAWRELTRIRTEVTEEVRAAFPVDDLPHLPHIPNAGSAVSSFVAGITEPIKSTLGGAVSATRGAATGGSDQVVSHVEGEHDGWADESDRWPGATADELDHGTDEEAAWSDRSSARTPSVAFRPLEDWSLFADDPSMN